MEEHPIILVIFPPRFNDKERRRVVHDIEGYFARTTVA